MIQNIKRLLINKYCPAFNERMCAEILKERGNRRRDLERKGHILCDKIRQKLIECGLNLSEEIYLDTILNYITRNLPHKSAFLKMFYYEDNKCSVVLEDMRPASEYLRADSDSFVNAAGKFLLEAIERGVVTLELNDVLRKGLESSEYKVRSNLREPQKSWLRDIYNKNKSE